MIHFSRLFHKDGYMKGFSQKGVPGALALVWALSIPPASAQVPPPSPQAPKARGSVVTATPAQRMFGDISPKFAELTDKVLYGDVWERPGLSKRDRSLVTVSALVAQNRPDQLRSHLRIARENGVTEAELVEAITHLAFYSGWPNAVTAISIAKEVFAKP
jgi:4-carboxymuconolactone decarboxylase